MQRMSRFYLGHCGYRTAWFDGEILPLTDPVTDVPTDTILHLENGGGKTTLMSLIFSCFETEQNKFLKHLQEANNRFSQYFDQTGIPGFIAVEWVLPPRTAKEARSAWWWVRPCPCALPWSRQTSIGSFLIPATGRPAAGGPSCAAAWPGARHESGGSDPVAAGAENSPSRCFFIKNQAEWKKHLQVDRLIDLEMLKMQVGFSARGGFDAFIRMKTNRVHPPILFLTLDTTRADEVRKLVLEVCEKHSRKPVPGALPPAHSLQGPAVHVRGRIPCLPGLGRAAGAGPASRCADQRRIAGAPGCSRRSGEEHRQEEQLQQQIRQQADTAGGRLARSMRRPGTCCIRRSRRWRSANAKRLTSKCKTCRTRSGSCAPRSSKRHPCLRAADHGPRSSGSGPSGRPEANQGPRASAGFLVAYRAVSRRNPADRTAAEPDDEAESQERPPHHAR